MVHGNFESKTTAEWRTEPNRRPLLQGHPAVSRTTRYGWASKISVHHANHRKISARRAKWDSRRCPLAVSQGLIGRPQSLLVAAHRTRKTRRGRRPKSRERPELVLEALSVNEGVLVSRLCRG